MARSASCSIPSPCMSIEPRKYMAYGSSCAAAFDSHLAPAFLSSGMSSPSHNIIPKLYWAFITPAFAAFSNNSAACLGSASMPSPSINAWPSRKVASPSLAFTPSCKSFSSSAERALRGSRRARLHPRILEAVGRREAHMPPTTIAPRHKCSHAWPCTAGKSAMACREVAAGTVSCAATPRAGESCMPTYALSSTQALERSGWVRMLAPKYLQS
mmetsp:Transcript_43219/g.99635  ORF Transcript_43219/g.99635 Transcript_43219/m.99635 type:complete len:214 (-) Transcript_43219:1-642(-)